jgi:hypothetical protein
MHISGSLDDHRAAAWFATSGLHIVLIAALTFVGVRLLRTVSRRLFEGLAGRAMGVEQKEKTVRASGSH